MSLIKKIENPEAKFDLYFMAYNGPKAVSHGNSFVDREGVVELTHNYGTENDASFKYHNGNDQPQGFGHTCISVDNIQAACKRLEDAGYKFQKKLTDGRMRHIAFALDPDGYWVEIIGQKPVEETENVTETDQDTYRMVSSGTPQTNT
jgi:lactoylglutathione lyase